MTPCWRLSTARTASLRYDESIQSIISAETASFFAGETTAEETASRIQNRVRLYIAEQS